VSELKEHKKSRTHHRNNSRRNRNGKVLTGRNHSTAARKRCYICHNPNHLALDCRSAVEASRKRPSLKIEASEPKKAMKKKQPSKATQAKMDSESGKQTLKKKPSESKQTLSGKSSESKQTLRRKPSVTK
jgi:hypothetical protein